MLEGLFTEAEQHQDMNNTLSLPTVFADSSVAIHGTST